uniref:uncharacterized protein LOC120331811 n=1 Tax=Styela clava TaxID=7725 RepID=UPI00193990C4|nr:uncharacterized protein LOC120331811 [Styela clava]
MDDGPKKGNIGEKALVELESSVDEPESQKLSATPHRSQIKEKTKEKPDKKQKSALEEKPTKKAFLAGVADNKAVPFGGPLGINLMRFEEEIEPEHAEDAIQERNQPPHDQNDILEEIEVVRQDIGNLRHEVGELRNGMNQTLGNLRQEFRDNIGELRNAMNQITALLMEQNQQRQQNQQPSDDMGQQPPSDMGQSNRDRQ